MQNQVHEIGIWTKKTARRDEAKPARETLGKEKCRGTVVPVDPVENQRCIAREKGEDRAVGGGGAESVSKEGVGREYGTVVKYVPREVE